MVNDNDSEGRDSDEVQEEQATKPGFLSGGSILPDSRITRRPFLKSLLATPMLPSIATDAEANIFQEGGDGFSDDFETESLEDYVAEYGEKSDWSIEEALDDHAALGSIPSGTSFLKLDPAEYSWDGDRNVSVDFKADTSNWKRNAKILLEDGEDAYIVNAAIQGDTVSLIYDEGTNGNWESVESTNHNISDWDRHTLSADVSGDTCTISVDGEEVISPTLESELGEGSVGFGIKGDIPIATWFDNLSIEGGRPDSGQEDSDVELTDIQIESGPYSLGDSVPAEVTVENKRDIEGTFFVGYSATPNGSNESYDNNGSTGQAVTLLPGESLSVDVSVTIPEEASTGAYTLISSVWEESNPEDLETRLDTITELVTIGTDVPSVCDIPPIGPYDIELNPHAASFEDAFFVIAVNSAGGNYGSVSPICIETREDVRVRRVTPLDDEGVLEAVGGEMVVSLAGAANPTPIPLTDFASIYSTYAEESREEELSNVNSVDLELRGEVGMNPLRFLVWLETSGSIDDWSTPQGSVSISEDTSPPVRVSYTAEREPNPSETEFEGLQTRNIFCMDFSTDDY
mgnify:CR=1 FL=1